MAETMTGMRALMNFFGTPEKPVTMTEMKEFKASCSDEEWEQYKKDALKVLGQE